MDHCEKENRMKNPRETANIMSILTFAWVKFSKLFLRLKFFRELFSSCLNLKSLIDIWDFELPSKGASYCGAVGSIEFVITSQEPDAFGLLTSSLVPLLLLSECVIFQYLWRCEDLVTGEVMINAMLPTIYN